MSDENEKAEQNANQSAEGGLDAVDMTLLELDDPPEWSPKNIEIPLAGGSVNFLTQEGATVTVDITPPGGSPQSTSIPLNDWTPTVQGNWTVTYDYKGGSTSGNINVTVSE